MAQVTKQQHSITFFFKMAIVLKHLSLDYAGGKSSSAGKSGGNMGRKPPSGGGDSGKIIHRVSMDLISKTVLRLKQTQEFHVNYHKMTYFTYFAIF